MTKTSPLLECRHLSSKFGLRYPDICFEEAALSFVSGKSGSGKSTLLKLLSLNLLPQSGEIYYRNQSIYTLDPLYYRRQVLFCSQAPFLFEGSLGYNFYQYSELLGEVKPEPAAIKTLLRGLDLDLPLSKSTLELSGGERQRAFVALALYFAKDVLILDEPTAALDKKTAFAVLDFICQTCRSRQLSLISVCHDPELLAHFAEQIIDLDEVQK